MVEPIEYIHLENDEPFYEYNSYNTHQCLTGNHKVVYRNRINDTAVLEDKLNTITVDEIRNSDFRGRIPTTFINDGAVDVEENMLRLAIAVQADGTMPFSNSYRVKARFSKERKIERFKQLLEACNIEYKLVEDKSDSNRNTGYKNRWEFRFYSEDLYKIFKDESKTFPKEWYNLSLKSKLVFLDEIFKWDGHNETYISTNKNNAELVYYIINSSGYSADISEDIRKNSQRLKPCYYVGKRFYKSCGFNKKWKEINKKDKYCFVVPSHMLVLRRKGQTFITNNCGWGNRCLAAIASKYQYNYFGTDPNSDLQPCYKAQADFVRDTIKSNSNVDIRCHGSEVFIPEWEGKMDLSFTSPPYFNTERYCEESTQSAAMSGGNYYSWRDDFMRPTIKNVYRYLKPGAYYLLNLKNLTPTFGSFPALNDWAIVAQQEGFILENIEVMYYQSSRQFGTSKKTGKKREVKFVGDKEPVLVLKKPINKVERPIIMLYPNTIDKSWENRNKKRKVQ